MAVRSAGRSSSGAASSASAASPRSFSRARPKTIVKRTSPGVTTPCSRRAAMADAPFEVLRPFERFAFRVMRFWNLGAGARLGALWQRFFITPFVTMVVARRLEVHGLDRLADIEPGAPML